LSILKTNENDYEILMTQFLDIVEEKKGTNYQWYFNAKIDAFFKNYL
jgi:hypothetical protein